MDQELQLNRPWLVAVWPGMGHVSINAGYYLMSKLGMYQFAEFAPNELFDVEHVEVKDGLIQSSEMPRNRMFLWRDPNGKRDLIVFIGEAQPPSGKYAFCRQLIEQSQKLGVERVYTFAAMATQMQLEQNCRVFGAATNKEILAELKDLKLEVLEDGQIGGLNGILLGIAAEMGLNGACLLGEMPHVFVQFPFPRASLAVLKVFSMIANIDLETTELTEQANAVDRQLKEIVEALKESREPNMEEAGEASGFPSQSEFLPEDEQRIEELFQQAEQDRSKAYELKRELDRLGLFDKYEDRFLDLFKQQD